MLLDPPMIPTNPNATILTNSGKYAHYGKLLMFWTRLESGSFFKRTQFILIVNFFLPNTILIGPGLTGRKFRLGSMKDCVTAAWTGSLPRRSSTRYVPWKTMESRSFSSAIQSTARLGKNGWKHSMRNHHAIIKHAYRLFK